MKAPVIDRGTRIRWLIVLAALLAFGIPPLAGAQPAWRPERAIEIVAPATPGGGTDKMARLIQKIWQERRYLDVPIAVVNKPGGGGGLSLAYLRQHSGDPHVLLSVSALLLTNHIVGRSEFTYTDFTPIALLNSEYVVVAVKNDSPLSSLKDVVVRLKQDETALSIAVGMSLGGANHIAAAELARAAGKDARKIKTVVFKSAPESVVATLGRHVDAITASASLVLPHFQSGAMRILAISAPRRASGPLAGIPTFKEQGVDAAVDNFRLVIGAAGISAAQAAFWEQAMARLAREDEWKKDLERNLLENTYMNRSETRRYLDEQYAQLRNILIQIGLAK